MSSNSYMATRFDSPTHVGSDGARAVRYDAGRQDTVSQGKMMVRKSDGSMVDASELVTRYEAMEKLLVQMMTENAKLKTLANVAHAKGGTDNLALDSNTSIRPDHIRSDGTPCDRFGRPIGYAPGEGDRDPEAEMRSRSQNAWRQPLGQNTSRTDSRPLAPADDPNSDDYDPVEAMKRRTYERGRRPLGGG